MVSMESSMQMLKHGSMREELKKNFVFSPLSIRILLSIVASGRNAGPTLDHFLSLLGFKTLADLHAYASDDQLNSTLFSPSKHPQGPVLSSSNGSWVDKKFAFNPFFSPTSPNPIPIPPRVFHS
ncbi:hypothetical protein TIFTF001_001218 [Ficus carica]|uniref:Serpin domain-containing protein n=1 Tax=Ficus carica TaxID=3494 RepID=A0AA88D439_FICCA|nr:hypothetical protein TIFTF001_001218 [Ficus carica]